jgi:hypothetical protein
LQPRVRVSLLILFALTAALLSRPTAYAQQSGHYLQGASGLENGSTAPPGLFISYLPYVYDINALKGPEGNTFLKPDLSVVANNVVYAVTTQKKILGATYGLSFIVPVVNTRFDANVFDVSAQSAGVSDIYFAPVVLGWQKDKFNYLLNYGFYAPTGNFNPSSSMNPGLGFWENQIQAGATYSIDKKKLWNASLLTTWEINMSKTDLAVKPGPMFTGEYSFGHRFGQYKWNAGVAGYGYKKLSPDSGAGINPLLVGITDRSFGIGPEIKYTNINRHLSFDFRYEYQFGVEAKTSGNVFVATITFLNLLPPPHH